MARSAGGIAEAGKNLSPYAKLGRIHGRVFDGFGKARAR
jgi:hypothetical protein